MNARELRHLLDDAQQIIGHDQFEVRFWGSNGTTGNFVIADHHDYAHAGIHISHLLHPTRNRSLCLPLQRATEAELGVLDAVRPIASDTEATPRPVQTSLPAW